MGIAKAKKDLKRKIIVCLKYTWWENNWYTYFPWGQLENFDDLGYMDQIEVKELCV